MSDKPVAGLVTALAVAPFAAVCCLGPAYLASAVAWIGGWLGGIGAGTATALAILAGILVYGYASRRRARASQGRADAPPAFAAGGPRPMANRHAPRTARR